MKCKGKFKFKELKLVPAGSFTTADGEIINYAESYKLKADEITEKGIFERTFKVASDSANIIEVLKKSKPYTDIDIEFDLNIYSNGCSLIPVQVFTNDIK